MVTFQFYRNIREIQEMRVCIYYSLADREMCSVGTCLLLRNFNGVSENCPENTRVAGRGCQGSFVAIILIQSVRK